MGIDTDQNHSHFEYRENLSQSLSKFIRSKILVLGKIFSAIISKSLSIASSAIDSTIDLMLNFAIWWAARAIRKRNPFLYPQGLHPSNLFFKAIFHIRTNSTRTDHYHHSQHSDVCSEFSSDFRRCSFDH